MKRSFSSSHLEKRSTSYVSMKSVGSSAQHGFNTISLQKSRKTYLTKVQTPPSFKYFRALPPELITKVICELDMLTLRSFIAAVQSNSHLREFILIVEDDPMYSMSLLSMMNLPHVRRVTLGAFRNIKQQSLITVFDFTVNAPNKKYNIPPFWNEDNGSMSDYTLIKPHHFVYITDWRQWRLTGNGTLSGRTSMILIHHCERVRCAAQLETRSVGTILSSKAYSKEASVRDAFKQDRRPWIKIGETRERALLRNAIAFNSLMRQQEPQALNNQEQAAVALTVSLVILGIGQFAVSTVIAFTKVILLLT